ncbi:MAG: hypothetical protein COS85_05855 [Armatimonadetes bacterium CG07_land_8_20_14_0_80_59_28]|nr:MAG: hypothetical protein COS85_05855 [Armatimonadetes bacterium CG07_land_8_20_14_0_80_59_28]PIY37380.1 MAG: hypothetical protein COZ05_22475 [Armatimonadetes bacterium CG_4_10_14_3_um_filter_59_10]
MLIAWRRDVLDVRLLFDWRIVGPSAAGALVRGVAVGVADGHPPEMLSFQLHRGMDPPRFDDGVVIELQLVDFPTQLKLDVREKWVLADKL